ncbi:MAG: hypothetical protein B6D45_11720, partial [Ignavibacteriales bacterium UTCHB3]
EFILFESEYSGKNSVSATGDITAPGSAAGVEIGKFDDEMKQVIKLALAKCGGKIYGNNGAAALLGLKPTTLQSKMKKLGIK